MHTLRSQQPRGLRRGCAAVRLLGLRVRIPPGHGCLSVVSVQCYVQVSASGRSLVQRSPTEYCVSAIEEPRRRGTDQLGLWNHEKNYTGLEAERVAEPVWMLWTGDSLCHCQESNHRLSCAYIKRDRFTSTLAIKMGLAFCVPLNSSCVPFRAVVNTGHLRCICMWLRLPSIS
jgi:hypothetical protein